MARRPTGFAGFTTMWTGQMLSALGTRMTNFALSIWVWEATGRATDLVMLVFFAFGATVLFSPIAGSLIDRWNRRLTVLISDLGSAVATTVLLMLFLTGTASMWHLYLVNAITGACLAFQAPAYSATITLMMEKGRYTRANAMMFTVRFLPTVFAPALAATALSVASIEAILLVDALSYLVAIGTVLLVVMPELPISASSEPSSFRQDLSFGFRYIARNRSLAGLETILFAINLFASIGYVLLIPFILARSGDNAVSLGVVQTVGAVGGVIGAVLLGVLRPTPNKMRRVLVAILVFSVVGRIVYGVGTTLVVWAFALLFVHLCIPFIDGYAQAIWQEKVEPAVQGRVFSARQFIEDLTVPVGALIAGPLVDNHLEPWMQPGQAGARVFGGVVGTGPGAGMGLVFVAVGVLGVAVAVVGFALPSVRRIETLVPDHDAVPPAPPGSVIDPTVDIPDARPVLVRAD
jgi:DHA3 family macrolide efflux protein-like MFS transporter